jgi:hypothetical protein
MYVFVCLFVCLFVCSYIYIYIYIYIYMLYFVFTQKRTHVHKNTHTHTHTHTHAKHTQIRKHITHIHKKNTHTHVCTHTLTNKKNTLRYANMPWQPVRAISCIRFAPNGMWVAIGGTDGSLRCYSTVDLAMTSPPVVSCTGLAGAITHSKCYEAVCVSLVTCMQMYERERERESL